MSPQSRRVVPVLYIIATENRFRPCRLISPKNRSSPIPAACSPLPMSDKAPIFARAVQPHRSVETAAFSTS
jgi:hypothetical protein